MKNTKIKICGVVDVKTAVSAERLGADAIGLVFCKKSKRCISVEEAKEVIHSLQPFTSIVALFSNDEEDYVQNILNELKINLIQFHGDENDEYCTKYNLPYIKGISEINDGYKNLDYKFPNAKGFVVDSHEKDGIGGTGKTFDWSKGSFDTKKPIIIAGGLNCDNVKDAIKAFMPYGVDVSSGVESSPGIKDINLIEEFIEQIKNEE